jgi:hypothetical protein
MKYVSLRLYLPAIFSSEDGDSVILRNFDVYLQVYTAIQPRTTTTSTTPLEFLAAVNLNEKNNEQMKKEKEEKKYRGRKSGARRKSGY